ncbi:hypothetical protein FQ087_14235 [Sporosarcina sp. ANT_H38]|uniref:hypothetical protein n=1 Tax=Sporosarcina sp. ANT_H38 TaxID=2597358 RepID=UPI0011F2205A|nr:hypothetical protein [Sporosarcina sp. ANT_H38]KAA0955750.1 hypothetical protein FQ087_14235 [Sporosarcina sp. ANT_H38]
MKKRKVWDRIKLPIASVSWLVSILVVLVITYNEVPLYYYLGFGFLALLFFGVSDRAAFFFYITLILVTVFYFLFLAFKNSWQPGEQALAIGLHFIFLIHLFSLYSLSKYVYQIGAENRLLKKRISQLEEYILEEGVLTKREFEKQAVLILANMSRRNEIGFYLKADLSDVNRTVRKKVMHTLASMMYAVFRKNYDIVGQYNDSTLIVLVQNTEEKGLEIVRGRLEKLLVERLEENAVEKIRWTVMKIEGDKTLRESVVVT